VLTLVADDEHLDRDRIAMGPRLNRDPAIGRSTSSSSMPAIVRSAGRPAHRAN
jgi:hypothetical protein